MWCEDVCKGVCSAICPEAESESTACTGELEYRDSMDERRDRDVEGQGIGEDALDSVWSIVIEELWEVTRLIDTTRLPLL